MDIQIGGKKGSIEEDQLKIDKNKIKVELKIYQIGKGSKKLIIDDYISYSNLLKL